MVIGEKIDEQDHEWMYLDFKSSITESVISRIQNKVADEVWWPIFEDVWEQTYVPISTVLFVG